MQNGGLSSYVSNPFSLLSGNKAVSTTTATSKGTVNLTGSAAVTTSSVTSSRGDPFNGLNKSQINALWGLGPSALYRPNNVNIASANMLPTSGSRLGMSMNGPYAGAYGGLMPPSGVYPR